MNITYQGVPGSFSHITATKYFGTDNNFIGTKQFKEIFENIKKGEAQFAAVPVENTLAGTVYENYDHINNYSVHVIGEYNLKVEHHLLAVKSSGSPEVRIKNIKKVYSHIKALEQCQVFFDKYPWIEETVYSDTAGAAQMVAEKNDPTIAAIASSKAAELYKLETLQSNIEDDTSNFTRFLILSSKNEAPKEANKCSLIFTLPHIPGSLYMTLGIFSDNKMNLTKIESRPIHGKPFEYNFYVDLEFDEQKYEEVKKIIAEQIPTVTQTLKVLGFYKSAHHIE